MTVQVLSIGDSITRGVDELDVWEDTGYRAALTRLLFGIPEGQPLRLWRQIRELRATVQLRARQRWNRKRRRR